MASTRSQPPYGYCASDATHRARWAGRNDGDGADVARWHQRVSFLDLTTSFAEFARPTACFIGYASDLGVRMNRGRAGAAEGASALRERMSNLPAVAALDLVDCGDVVEASSVLATQEALAWAVERIVRAGGMPVILGGGHDQAYGHFLGIAQATGKAPGCLNFDAHADLRPIPADGPNSGTPYTQAAEWCAKHDMPFHYAIVGWQDCANTQLLVRRAEEVGAEILRATMDVDDVQLLSAIRESDALALSIDLDVFAAAYAPGVSAPTAMGLVPDGVLLETLRNLFVDGYNIAGIEVAELCPEHDIDGRTARLGAALIFTLLTAYAQARLDA